MNLNAQPVRVTVSESLCPSHGTTCARVLHAAIPARGTGSCVWNMALGSAWWVEAEARVLQPLAHFKLLGLAVAAAPTGTRKATARVRGLDSEVSPVFTLASDIGTHIASESLQADITCQYCRLCGAHYLYRSE